MDIIVSISQSEDGDILIGFNTEKTPLEILSMLQAAIDAVIVFSEVGNGEQQ